MMADDIVAFFLITQLTCTIFFWQKHDKFGIFGKYKYFLKINIFAKNISLAIADVLKN